MTGAGEPRVDSRNPSFPPSPPSPSTGSSAWLAPRPRDWRAGSASSTSPTGDPREETPEIHSRDSATRCQRDQFRTRPRGGDPPSCAPRRLVGCKRRFGVTPRFPSFICLPTNGSKEALYSVHQGSRRRERDPRPVVLIPDPRVIRCMRSVCALRRCGESSALPLREDRGFPSRPRLTRARPLAANGPCFWIKLPEQPDHRPLPPLAFFEEAAALARRHGFWLASDEAYSEIYFGDPPPSSLQTGTRQHCRLPNAEQAVGHDGIPQWLHGWRPGNSWAKLRQVRPSQGVAHTRVRTTGGRRGVERRCRM